ncbi:MAG: phosphoribosyltransferase family protein [Candidatus Pacearchaeota archaeon]
MVRELNLSLVFIIVRKLPLPDKPESGLGAISKDGSCVFNSFAKFYSKEVINNIIKKQKKEIGRRIRLLRKNKNLDLTDKSVIIIDDGLSMGSSMEVAVKTCRNFGAKTITIVVPTASKAAVKKFEKLVEKVVCIDIRENFVAVADAYEEWHDVDWKEISKILKNSM